MNTCWRERLVTAFAILVTVTAWVSVEAIDARELSVVRQPVQSMSEFDAAFLAANAEPERTPQVILASL